MDLSVYTTLDFQSLTTRQKISFCSILAGENTFITGGGGVGKSHLIKTIVRHKPNTVLCASIGLMAINIGGQTIDSFMGFTKGIKSIDVARSMPPIVKKRLKEAETLLIDEIGTVRCDAFDAINARLQAAKGNDLPFGGIQVILLGDFCQMKPIVPKKGLEAEYLKEMYQGRVFAFESDSWPLSNIQYHVLNEYFRQEDEEQARLLRLLRLGKNIPHVVKQINKLTRDNHSVETDIRLCTKVVDVNRINDAHYSTLNGREFTYIANKKPPQELTLAPAILKLKVGASVMLCANNIEKGYYNGDLGIVSKLNKNKITVTLRRGETIEVERYEWQEIEQYFSKGKLVRDVVNTYSQFPVQLSYAMTIHKSQGLTLDGVILDLSTGTFSEGQSYVGLSRVKSFKRLTLVRPLTVEDIKFSTKAINFTLDISYAAIDRFESDLLRFPQCA